MMGTAKYSFCTEHPYLLDRLVKILFEIDGFPQYSTDLFVLPNKWNKTTASITYRVNEF